MAEALIPDGVRAPIGEYGAAPAGVRADAPAAGVGRGSALRERP